MRLHDRAEGHGLPVILLHGLFGSGDNLGVIARGLTDEYRVHSLDLRNHGRSPHAEAMDYPSMAGDVLETLDDLDIDQVIAIGHSMGGKTAMELTMAHADRVSHLVVLDIAPVTYEHGHETELEAMRGLDLSAISSRRDADQALACRIENPGVRQFLLKNLSRSDDGFAWRIPLDTIADQYEQISAAPAEGRYDGPTLFICGGQSDYVRDQDIPEIEVRFPRYQLRTIVDSGHWVHNDAPTDMLSLIEAFLDAASC